MELKEIGFLSRTHGLKGHLVLNVNVVLSEQINVLFIELNGSQVPFFIEEITDFKNALLVKLESIDSVEAAQLYKNKAVFAEKKQVAENNEFEFLNYTLIDVEKGQIGHIEEFIENPGNPILKINSNKREILIPFNATFIEKVNKKDKQLIYRCPDGLLDIYMS